jgi:hypothetical protein
MNRTQAQETLGHRVHVVARRGAVQHVGLEHRVVALALQMHAVIGEHVDIELQMLTELGVRWVFEQRPQRFEYPRAFELRRRTGVVMRQRHVGCMSGLDAE